MSQIITVTFAPGQYEAVADQPLAQWAYGQKLKFVGLELPAAYAVDFSNWEFQGDSIQRIGNADGVAVPTEILTSGRNVYAFIWITDANSGRRRYMAMARVIPGPGPDPEEPNPQESSEISEVLAELNAAVETAEDAASRGPQIRDGYWYTWNAESQEYESTGVPSTGNKIWWTTSDIYPIPGGVRYTVLLPDLNGPEGASPAVSDLVVGPAPSTSGSATYLYYIFYVDTANLQAILKSIGSIKGAPGDPGDDGYSPEVTITEIDGGHRVTITDEEHPQGQTFDVMDGQGGSGSSDYDDLTNKPQIAGVTLRGDKSLADLGIAPAGAYVKPSGGIPKSDLASDVRTSLGKADTALQSVPSTYRTAEAQDAIDSAQDTAIAGKLSTTGNAYRAASIPMGELDSTSTATVMTATVPGITELRDGVCVWLRNGVITSASGVTLNINSLGAKPIYNSLAGTIVTTTFTEASTYLFVYNSTRVTGGCWDMVYGYDTNTTYTPAKLGQGYAVCSTAAATAAKTASISSYALVAGGIVAIKFANDVPAGATLDISSKGAKAIYYQGVAITAGVIKAGDTVTMIYSTYYHVLSIDRDADTQPPQPSDATPYSVNYPSLPGTSSDYARADHTHDIDLTYLEDRIADISAVNVPVFYDGENGVYIPYTPQALAGAYRSQMKIDFALVVPPNFGNYPVLFTPSKFDTTTGELHLTGIVGGVLYEATLLPGADPTSQTTDLVFVGTMTTTNLALPSALKAALLQLAQKVAYIDDQGSDYYQDLYDALYQPIDLVSISATFTQSGTVYDTDTLDSLKADLVVTAVYSDGSTQTIPAAAYTLSGTLAEGTSTVTVSYGGKTTSFDVTVSISLDSIAFGTLTYRDLFITNNEVIIGDFETALSLSSTAVSLGDGRSYKINAGSPSQSTEQYESPTHSLKCFGSSSAQILYKNTDKQFLAQPYLFCVSVKVSRYSAGKAGMQFTLPANGTIVTQHNVSVESTTSGFSHLAKIVTLSGTDAQRKGINIFIGSFSSANLDAYVDDVICTPVPADMTEAKALELYTKYLTLIGA